ncbi:MAG: hypothetical protein IKA99_06260, partial [Clostridia bacterium]|nr:hypothetical protein [Clostridia bacterium]
FDAKQEINGELQFVLDRNFRDVLQPLFNLKVMPLVTEKDKVKIIKDAFADLLVGDLLYDLMRKFANEKLNLGFEGKLAFNAKQEINGELQFVLDRNFRDVLQPLFNLKVMPLVTEKDKVKIIKDAYADLLVGDLLYDLTRKFLKGKFDWGVEGLACENKKNSAYDVDNIVIEKIFNINIFNFISERDKVKFIKETFASIKLGEIAGTFVKTLKPNGDRWEHNGKYIKLIIGDVLGVSVNEVFDIIGAKNKVKAVTDTMCVGRTVHDYIADLLGKEKIGNAGADELLELFVVTELVDTLFGFKKDETNKMSSDPKIAYILNRTDKVFFGDFANLTSSDDNKQWYDKNGNKVTGITNTIYSLPSSVVLYVVAVIMNPKMIVDVMGESYLGTFIKDFYNKTKIDSTINGDDKSGYTVDGAFKELVEDVANVKVKTIYNDIVNKSFKKKATEMFINREMGDILYDVLVQFVYKQDKYNLDIGGYASDKVVEGKYVLSKNFKDIFEPFFNIQINELLKEKNKLNFFLNNVYSQTLIGDALYDITRKLAKTNKIELGLDGEYAYVNKANNGGKFFADQNFSAIISKTFNLGIKQVYDAYKNKIIKAVLYNTYSDLSLGDIFYDVFRKFMAKKLTLSAQGYAWQFATSPELYLQGKIAKFVRAVFAVTLADVYDLVKKRVTKTEFAVHAIGHLNFGETLLPFAEKTLKKNLSCKFEYDVANDYALTITGNYAEVLNAVAGISMSKALQTKKMVTLFFGAEGALENMPAGHVAGYLVKTKALSKTFKKTTIEHEYDGAWIISGTYAVPMNILCNDLTLGTIYANRNKLKSGLIIPYFGKVELGNFAGGTLVNGAWIKSNGEPHPTHGAKNVIMLAFYDLTVEEILAKGFDPSKVIEDVYAGQIMGYYRCGEYEFSKNEDTDYIICGDETHVDDKGAYHLHEGEEIMYSVVEGSEEFVYCDQAHVDDLFTYHTHYICEFEEEHEHTGKGWYYKEGGEYKKAGAVESAVADLTLKKLMSGRFSMAETLKGVKLGEAMNLVHCDGSGATCPITEVSSTHVCEEGWYEKKVEGGNTTYVRTTLVLDKIADVDLHELFTNGLDLDAVFEGVYAGDVLGYSHCYIDEDGNRVCAKELEHGDTDHKTTNMWYVKTDSNNDGVIDENDEFRKATALERTFASVIMTDILNGKFDVEKELENITLGEFMGHEKCTHDDTCFVHPDGAHVAGDDWYDEQDDGTYVAVTDNLTLAVADFTIKQMQSNNFANELLDSVKGRVTLGDVFGDPAGTPLALLGEDTTIGNINGALTDALKTSTAGDMYDAKILPFDDETIKKMDASYGLLVVNDAIDTNTGNTEKDNDYKAKIEAALNAHATEVRIPTDPDYMVYVEAVGRTFWRSLTADQLLEILVDALPDF